ncbi:beta strand repeat-containing protein [Roseiconus lacunae]|uniref:PEP-CTERM sorting domain-containing protein n=1 Tax=Roseiconus lacunae TaxID=2605694 RepID=A0ABT7PNT8_9BACT|nr:PEP-CTERM sorting domain-containing protein [Roseiconus lacunae]MDM4017944.1 PEP-CTERM sorting domain-containing protein [Roseiconus lacunae]
MIRVCVVLLVCVCASNSFGQRVTTQADDGTDGVNGASLDPGQVGTDGGIGASISEAIDAIGELYRGLVAGNGGRGGDGGNALSETFDGGSGGRGGNGGDASGSIRSEGTGRIVADLQISAGNGGDGGIGGFGVGTGADGLAGDGGDGGIATALADGAIAISSDGRARAALTVIGGSGGDALAGNANGGSGQDASIIGVKSSAIGITGADSLVEVQGGNGGNGIGTGNGGRGGNGTLQDAISVSVQESGDVNITQTIYAGAGGNAQAGIAGLGGQAINEFSKNLDAAEAAVSLYSFAGSGGSRDDNTGTSGNGGDASSKIVSTQTGTLFTYSETRGGESGDGVGGSDGGQGGDASAMTDLVTTDGMIDAYDVAWGGSGGWIRSGTGTGGKGGQATIDLSATTSGSDDVTLQGHAFGGDGGLAFDEVGGTGGDGATAGGSVSATTVEGLANAYGYFQGGSGGDVIGGNGNSGDGASVEIINQVTAQSLSSTGQTFVEQIVQGGDSGDVGYQSDFGTGNIGAAGDAMSSLSANNDNSDSTLWGFAYGGQGGDRVNSSGVGGSGAEASSSVILRNTGTASTYAYAGGGWGGDGVAGAIGGQGGRGIADASSVSENAEAFAESFAYGGDAGFAIDSEASGGNAFEASALSNASAMTLGIGQYAEAYAEAIGGFGLGENDRYLSSRSGVANSEATATTNQGEAYAFSSAEGRQAIARSTGEGVSGFVTATAETVRGALGDENDDPVQVWTQISADVKGITSVEASVLSDGTIGSGSTADAFSIVDVSAFYPDQSGVIDESGLLASSALVASSQLTTESTVKVVRGLIGGEYGSVALGVIDTSIETTLQFNDSQESSNVLIAWESFEATGNGFDSMMVTIGSSMGDQEWSFSNLAEAQLFFSQAIEFSEITEVNPTLTMQLSWSSSGVGDGFSLGYAATVSAIPEPSTTWGLYLSSLVLISRRKRR